MAKPRKEKSGKKNSWLRYVIMLSLGGGSGVGGVLFKDHPILQRIFAKAVNRDPADGPMTKQEAIQAVVKTVSQFEAYRQEGDFTVTVTDLKLDSNAFRKGYTLDLHIKLLKQEASGRQSVVWDSRSGGEHTIKVGAGDIRTDWKDQPIDVSWKPGEKLSLEVWNGKRLFDKKCFEWTAEDAKSFPLRSGRYTLTSTKEVNEGAAPGRFEIEAKPGSSRDSGTIAKEGSEDIRIK